MWHSCRAPEGSQGEGEQGGDDRAVGGTAGEGQDQRFADGADDAGCGHRRVLFRDLPGLDGGGDATARASRKRLAEQEAFGVDLRVDGLDEQRVRQGGCAQRAFGERADGGGYRGDAPTLGAAGGVAGSTAALTSRLQTMRKTSANSSPLFGKCR